jgi:hypothetical protein
LPSTASPAAHVSSTCWPAISSPGRSGWQHWGSTAGELRRCGGDLDEIKGLPEDALIPAAALPESIRIVVAGANNAGESSLLVGYGHHSIGVIDEAQCLPQALIITHIFEGS